MEVKELLTTSFIKFPLKDAVKLREIKKGNYNVEEIINEVRDVLAEIDTLLLNTELPEESNKEVIKKIILNYVELYNM